ncbi:hypothetical protein Afil01_68470 [Actinorhabdospora filicis]|uniref:Uncharacterized protein n=1 Tax=Actinorhabdospora filicis TaxID=1785913 RepID=A0A9W6WEN5_9ACTN|nr:hypothetical protein [Actinorhabdospora filicis]GLZ82040.1 hypothetical protein Afil01_68470 [Actinorhabdospora filicis]
MEPVIVGYIVYLVVSAGMVITVSQILARNGLMFLREAFKGNESLAVAINRLLQVGFYLINFGFVALVMVIGSGTMTPRHVMESVVTRLGGILLLVGILHMVNLAVLSGLRTRATERRRVVHPLPPYPAGRAF